MTFYELLGLQIALSLGTRAAISFTECKPIYPYDIRAYSISHRSDEEAAVLRADVNFFFCLT